MTRMPQLAILPTGFPVGRIAFNLDHCRNEKGLLAGIRFVGLLSGGCGMITVIDVTKHPVLEKLNIFSCNMQSVAQRNNPV